MCLPVCEFMCLCVCLCFTSSISVFMADTIRASVYCFQPDRAPPPSSSESRGQMRLDYSWPSQGCLCAAGIGSLTVLSQTTFKAPPGTHLGNTTQPHPNLQSLSLCFHGVFWFLMTWVCRTQCLHPLCGAGTGTQHSEPLSSSCLHLSIWETPFSPCPITICYFMLPLCLEFLIQEKWYSV